MSIAQHQSINQQTASVSPRWLCIAMPFDVLIFAALFSFSFHAWDWMWYSVPLLFALSILRVTFPLYLATVLGMSGGVFWSFGSSFLRELSKPHSTIGLVTVVVVGGIVSLGLLYLTLQLIGGGLISPEPVAISPQEPETVQPTEPAIEKSDTDNPYRTLGINPDATQNEIRAAYLKEIQLYHPDRVALLGPDLKQLAHERSVQIQRAYETLRSA